MGLFSWFSNQSNGNSNDNWEEGLSELRAAKQDDSYHFSYEFEYIVKRLENDEYDIDTATMNVHLNWNDPEAGYDVTYDVPDMGKIDPAEGNGDAAEIYDYAVRDLLINDLHSIGIDSSLLVNAGF